MRSHLPDTPMDAALFNAVYAPLSVKFGCHITAQMPRELALKLADGLEQDVEDGLAILVEYCIQRRYFVELHDQGRSIAAFDCTQQQYDNKQVPAAVIEVARAYDSASSTTPNTKR